MTLQAYKLVNGVETKYGDPLTSDDKGQVSLKGLTYTDYIWKCESVPAGYQLLQNISYSISYEHLDHTDQAVLYMKHVKLILDAEVTDVIEGESGPSFMYHIEGTDAAGVSHSYDLMVDVDEDKLSGSNATKDMFAGTYTITQTANERYIADDAKAVTNSQTKGTSAEAGLLEQSQAEVLFPYHLENYGWFTSMHSLVNALEA